jgi:hypothetical protein
MHRAAATIGATCILTGRHLPKRVTAPRRPTTYLRASALLTCKITAACEDFPSTCRQPADFADFSIQCPESDVRYPGPRAGEVS